MGVGADVDLTDRRSCAAATSTDFDQLINEIAGYHRLRIAFDDLALTT